MGLQIREDARDELGGLSVVVVRRSPRGFLWFSSEDDSGLTALAMLRLLFAEHRCIVAVQLNDAVAKSGAVLDELALVPTLRRLTIVLDPNERPYGTKRLVHVVQSLVVTERVELEFITGFYYTDAETSLPVQLLEHPEARLTAFDVTGLAVDIRVAERLVNALLKNGSVTELAVGSHVFAPGIEATSSEQFARFLSEKKTTLKKLTLDGSDLKKRSNSWRILETLVRVICEMTSLEELALNWLCRVRDWEIIAQVVASGRSLRGLSVRCWRCCDGWVPHQPDFRPIAYETIGPWLVALKTNDTLQRLTIDLSLYTTEQCCSFIRAIAANVSIQTATVLNIPGGGFQDVYSTIRECRVGHRLVVEDHHVVPADVKGLQLFPEAEAITLSSLHSPDASALCEAFGDLAACDHVTSLRLRFDRYDAALYNAAADYVAANSTVKDIELYLNDFYEELDRDQMKCLARLIEAMASKRNVAKMKLHVANWRGDWFPLVADSALGSKTLYELSLQALDWRSCEAFLCCFLPELPRNHSLLRIALPACSDLHAQMSTVLDVTRRNCGLVERAARFVLGDGDPYCATAFALVSEHPKLIEVVGQKAGVTDTEAMAKIKDALQRRSSPTVSKSS